MAEEENYEDVDISDLEESDHYLNTISHSNHTDEIAAENLDILQNTEVAFPEDQITEEKRPQVQKPEAIRSTRLPMARIKNIMKMDPDVNVLSGDAVFLVTKATELFLETIAKETFAYTSLNKRKTLAKKDFDVVVNKVDCLCFLEGAMDF